MSQANNGDTIRVHYKGTLDNGTVFDDSEGRDPLQLTLGEHQVIPGFEAALVGMSVGESKTATIPSEEAYGERSEQLIIKAPRDKMPEGHEPEVGQQLQMTTPQGQPVPVQISEVTESEVTLDANHPLAGENLTFDLTLVEIV